MNTKTKSILSNLFGGLFSNNKAMEGAKTTPFWAGLIIVLISICLPIIPTVVSVSNSKGSDFLSSYVYGFDTAISKASLAMEYDTASGKEENLALLQYNKTGAKIDFKVVKTEDEAKLDYVSDTFVYSKETDTEPIVACENKKTNQYDLFVYYSQKTGTDATALKDAIEKNAYKVGTKEVDPDWDGTTTDGYYRPSYVILFGFGIYTRIYQDSSLTTTTSLYTAYASTWENTDNGLLLVESALIVDGQNKSINNTNYVKGVFDNWKVYYDQAYLAQKSYNIRYNILLYLIIYAVLVIVMGLLIFLLTRGKRNMFSYLTYLDCNKIVWWSALSPALLSLILGFILSSFGSMWFIITLGFRVMWISMKQLKPVQ